MSLLCGTYVHLWLVIQGTQGLSIVIIILPAFLSILRNVLTLQIASFIFFDSIVTFGNMMAYVF